MKWAIKWGYSYRPEFKDEYEEKEAMMTETSRFLAGHPRCWFSGEGRDEDPRSQTEDLGDDNMKANEYGVKNLKRVIAGLPQWTHQDNDQYSDLTEVYKSVRDQLRRYTGHVIKHLGLHILSHHSARGFEESVGKRTLAMVDMGNNAEIPDFVHVQFFNFFAKIVQIERKNNKLA